MAAPLYFLGIILLASRSYIIEAQLSVTSRHDSLLPSSATGAVEGSVLWLYCDVNSISSSLSVTWSKDGGSLVQDVPHIRLRTSTSSSSTTLLLVLDNMVFSDAGVYQCTAQDGLDTASGNELNITVLSSSADGMLRIVTQDPLTVFTGPVSYSSQNNAFYPNRTAVSTGAMVTLSFTSGHVGDDMNSYTTPTAVWLKDGAQASTTPTNMAVGGNGQLSSNLSFTFQASDAGVYQCVFSGSGPQVYWTIPLRLDTGSLTGPERVSPPVVFLTPPEKLVLEVRTSGGYDFIAWTRAGDRSFTQNPTTELVNFHEVFVRQPTTTSEYGTYRAGYSIDPGEARILVVPTDSPSTAAGTSATVTVSEGDNVNISCTSSGGSVPTVTWTINNQPTNFIQTDVITNPTDTTTPGHVMSTLHIINVQYPTHDGEYMCTGTNTISGSARTDSASITVQVQAVGEIVLIASATRVSIGERLTIMCHVIFGNPNEYTFEWYHNGALVTSTNRSSSPNSLTVDSVVKESAGIYECAIRNVAGNISNTIIIIIRDPAPRNVSFSATISSITLTWIEPPDFNITYYQIALNNSSFFLQRLYDMNNSERYGNGTWRATVTGLTEGTAYNITIRSNNGTIGQNTGLPAELVNVNTLSSAIIQLMFAINSECPTWVNENPNDKVVQVTDGILDILRRLCQCELSPSDTIENEGYLCYKDLPRFVTYRARIKGTNTVSVIQLITYLENWVSASGVLIVMGQLLPAQSYCPVQVRAANESQCILSTTEMTSIITTTTESTNYLYYMIAVAAAMVIALLVILLLIVIIGVLLNILKSSKKCRANEIELRSHKECTEHKTSTDPVNHESADIEDKYDPVNYESADIEDKSDPVNYESADIEDKSEGAIYENADGNEKISLASNEAYGISQVKRQ